MRRCVEGGEGHCAQQAACILRARQRGRAFWRRWRASRGAYPSDRKNCCGAKLEVAQRANGRLSSGSACADLAASSRRQWRRATDPSASVCALASGGHQCARLHGISCGSSSGRKGRPPQCGWHRPDPTRRTGVFANVFCRPTNAQRSRRECMSVCRIFHTRRSRVWNRAGWDRPGFGPEEPIRQESSAR